MKNDNRVNKIAKAAIIAALYALISIILKPISFGTFQLRVAEALSLLVLYTSAAPFGLFCGCLLANIFSPYGLLDMICGSLATLTAALIASKIKNKFLAGIPFVVVNAIVVSFVICFEAFSFAVYFPTAMYIGIEEALSVYVLGIPLTIFIEKNKKIYELIAD